MFVLILILVNVLVLLFLLKLPLVLVLVLVVLDACSQMCLSTLGDSLVQWTNLQANAPRHAKHAEPGGVWTVLPEIFSQSVHNTSPCTT